MVWRKEKFRPSTFFKLQESVTFILFYMRQNSYIDTEYKIAKQAENEMKLANLFYPLVHT